MRQSLGADPNPSNWCGPTGSVSTALDNSYGNVEHWWLPEEQDIVEGDVCAVPVHRGDERRVIDLGSHPGNAEHSESSRVSGVLQIFSDIISQFKSDR